MEDVVRKGRWRPCLVLQEMFRGSMLASKPLNYDERIPEQNG